MPDEPPYADRHVRWCERTAGQWLASYSILARASPALFAEKVLTHHKHLRKSTPPLRKPSSSQKALRALRSWLGHAGSTKFGRPRKTRAFFGAPELRPRAGVMRKRLGALGFVFSYSLVLGPQAGARKAEKKVIP